MVERDETKSQGNLSAEPASFGELWEEFLTVEAPETKGKLAFQFWNDFSGPETTKTICAFLSQTNREELSVNCQHFLLLCLHVSPSPEAIKIAEIYLDVDKPNHDLLEAAAWIIEDCAKRDNLLTPMQKRDYARRMREAIVRCREYDIAGVVPIIVNFEGDEVGEETIDWLCEILKHHNPLVRGASEAFELGLKLKPGKVVEALFFQLRNIGDDFWWGKANAAQYLIFALEDLNLKGLLGQVKDDDLGFLIDSIIEIRNLPEPDLYDYRKPVTDAILECGEMVRVILSKLPDDSASKKAISELLEGA